MSITEKMDALSKAVGIVSRARMVTIDNMPVWNKIQRINKYLESQQAELLKFAELDLTQREFQAWHPNGWSTK